MQSEVSLPAAGLRLRRAHRCTKNSAPSQGCGAWKRLRGCSSDLHVLSSSKSSGHHDRPCLRASGCVRSQRRVCHEEPSWSSNLTREPPPCSGRERKRQHNSIECSLTKKRGERFHQNLPGRSRCWAVAGECRSKVRATGAASRAQLYLSGLLTFVALAIYAVGREKEISQNQHSPSLAITRTPFRRPLCVVQVVHQNIDAQGCVLTEISRGGVH